MPTAQMLKVFIFVFLRGFKSILTGITYSRASPIRTQKGQNEVSVLVRCPYKRGEYDDVTFMSRVTDLSVQCLKPGPHFPCAKSLVKPGFTRVQAWLNQPDFSGFQTRLTRLYRMCKTPG